MATEKAKSAADQRSKALTMWLEAVNASELWSTRPVNSKLTLTMYVANGRSFIVQRLLYGDGGFEVYVPACDQNNVAATLEAARDYVVNGTAKRTGPISDDELTEIGERITMDRLDELKAMFP